MKIVVVGAAGMVSLSTLLYLADQNDISQIIAADIQEEKLKERLKKIGDDRLVARFIDLTDIKGSTDVFKGSQIVVNCAYQGYVTDKVFVDYELLAAEAALQAGANYICLGGAPPTPEFMSPAFSDEFNKKGLVAIQGMGASPGLTEVVAAYAINRMDKAESVEMFSVYKDLIPPEEHSRPLSLGHTLGGYVSIYTLDTVMYEDGKVKYFPPRSNRETLNFKAGPITVALTQGSSAIALFKSFPEIKNISYKTNLDPKLIFLRDLGFFSHNQINVEGQEVSPWEVLMTLIRKLPPETRKNPDIVHEQRVIVRGEKDGRKVEYDISNVTSCGLMNRFLKIGGIPGTSPTTGIAIAVAAMMMARGQVKGTGILTPAQCIPPDQYLDELIKAGMVIEIGSKTLM